GNTTPSPSSAHRHQALPGVPPDVPETYPPASHRNRRSDPQMFLQPRKSPYLQFYLRPRRCYHRCMTQLDVLYRYGVPPTEAATLAIAKIREVYGVRRI